MNGVPAPIVLGVLSGILLGAAVVTGFAGAALSRGEPGKLCSRVGRHLTTFALGCVTMVALAGVVGLSVAVVGAMSGGGS